MRAVKEDWSWPGVLQEELLGLLTIVASKGTDRGDWQEGSGSGQRE